MELMIAMTVDWVVKRVLRKAGVQGVLVGEGQMGRDRRGKGLGAV